MARRLLITGNVQGVGFRYSMNQMARRLGVNGWVRNCADGSVEAVIAGQDELVEALTAWSRKGPENARVTHVEVHEVAGEFSDFKILHDDCSASPS